MNKEKQSASVYEDSLYIIHDYRKEKEISRTEGKKEEEEEEEKHLLIL